MSEFIVDNLHWILLALLFAWIPILFLVNVYFSIKDKIWDAPHREIDRLNKEIKKLKDEIAVKICDRLSELDKYNSGVIIPELELMLECYDLNDLSTKINVRKTGGKLECRTKPYYDNSSGWNYNVIKLFEKALDDQMRLKYLLLIYPQLEELFIYEESKYAPKDEWVIKVKTPDEDTKELQEAFAFYSVKFKDYIAKRKQLLSDLEKLEAKKQEHLEREKAFEEKKEQLFWREINLNARERSISESGKDIASRYKSVDEYKRAVLEFADELKEKSVSNFTAIPYMAGMIADYETYGLENLANKLDWGHSEERAKKVKSIREIRAAAKAMVEKNLEAKYQLEYLLQLFPNLADVIETDYKDLPIIDVESVSEYDRTRDWLSKEEYQALGNTERNQLALDRYRESHNKSKWQIGRDYEMYVGYKYTQKGYDVDYYGSYMGLEDLGRDLIAKKDDKILIIQCKYWSHLKTIHEKHINQLYGTMICYCIENDLPKSAVNGLIVTNITLSETAKKMAKLLGIKFKENYELSTYPCIKCNIGREGNKIYHLPFDQQYDMTKIDKEGEFYALTVKEAEDAGFRRAFKWFGSA